MNIAEIDALLSHKHGPVKLSSDMADAILRHVSVRHLLLRERAATLPHECKRWLVQRLKRGAAHRQVILMEAKKLGYSTAITKRVARTIVCEHHTGDNATWELDDGL